MRAAGLVDGDEEFDCKAIAAAAHGVQFPSEGPLKFDRFSGGYATVCRKLEDHSSSAIRTIGRDWLCRIQRPAAELLCTADHS